MGGDPGEVHAATAVLDHQQDVQAAEEDVSTWAKSTARIGPAVNALISDCGTVRHPAAPDNISPGSTPCLPCPASRAGSAMHCPRGT